MFYGDVSTDYHKKRGFLLGIIRNLNLMPKYYPDWTMRVYVELDTNEPIFDELACESDVLDLCHAGMLPGTPMVDARRVYPMLWRCVFPTLDPLVMCCQGWRFWLYAFLSFLNLEGT